MMTEGVLKFLFVVGLVGMVYQLCSKDRPSDFEGLVIVVIYGFIVPPTFLVLAYALSIGILWLFS